MEEFKPQTIFHKIDRAVFSHIDKFKQTPNFNPIQDFYNALEEEQQKLFKGIVIVFILLLPLLGLGFFSWHNTALKKDLQFREEIITKANQIIGQRQGLQEIAPEIFSSNPIDSESMMSSRVSGLMSSMSIDLSKIQVSDFSSESISSNAMKAEAKFAFTNVSTDELMNIFSLLISREKFRIASVEIKRNPDTNMLQGSFRGFHYSTFSAQGEE